MTGLKFISRASGEMMVVYFLTAVAFLVIGAFVGDIGAKAEFDEERVELLLQIEELQQPAAAIPTEAPTLLDEVTYTTFELLYFSDGTTCLARRFSMQEYKCWNPYIIHVEQ